MEREGGKKRQTDREKTNRQTDTDTDRQTDTETQRDGDTYAQSVFRLETYGFPLGSRQ